VSKELRQGSGKIKGHSGFRELRRCGRHILSFESVFVLFLFAGLFKTDVRFSWIPFDLTAFLFGLSVLAASFVVIRKDFRFEAKTVTLAFLGVAFVVYADASLIWTSGEVYASTKALYISTLVFWCLCGTSLIIAAEPRRVRRFLIFLSVFSLWVTYECVKTYIGGGGEGFVNALVEEDTKSGYLGLGRLVGLGAVTILGYFLFYAKKAVRKALSLLVFFTMCFVLMVLGGRGPLIATASTLLVSSIWGWSAIAIFRGSITKRFVPLGLVVAVLGFGVWYMLISDQATQSLARVILVFRDGGLYSTDRPALFDAAVRFWAESPIIGNGIGSFPIQSDFADMRLYPHNIILEVLSELGIIGLVLLLALFVFVMRGLKIKGLQKDPVKIIVLMLLLNSVVNAMFSGDISDNRVVFVMLALTAFSGREKSYDKLPVSPSARLGRE
jgi:O-antigen ligase